MKSIIEKLINFRNERKWEHHHTGPELARSLMIEAAELNRIFQWPLNDNPVDIENLSEELANIAIYSEYLFELYGIDRDKAIIEKIEKNAKKYPL